MESINLGAVLFGILLLLWLAYALPRTASRRDVMGRTRAADEAEMSSQARDLSAAVHARRTSTESIEGNPPMSQDRLLLRPADPTSRPRFDAEPGTRIDPVRERARSRRLLGAVLGALLVVTAALVVLAALQIVVWWVPVLAAVGLAAYLVGLRRVELERRARLTRAATRQRRQRAEAETARRREAAEADGVARPAPAEITASAVPDPEPTGRADLETTSQRAAEQLSRPGEWTPRPVPRPTYALRGEVDDLASRHAAHRQSMLATSVPLESPRVEELEAVDESFAPAQDLQLDEILARRRA